MTTGVNLKGNITLNSSKVITNICKPFFNKTGATLFDFLRVYKDQSHICLTTHKDWNEYYYSNGFYIGSRHEYYNIQDVSKVSLEDFTIPIPKPIVKDKAIGVFNIAHGLEIIRKNQEYKDTYTFASHPQNNKINLTYLSNLEIFNFFIDYFMLVAAPIIREAEKEKFYFPEPAEETLTYFNNVAEIEKISLKEFYEQIKGVKIPVKIEDQIVYLTKKEIECLRGQIIGKTSKAISEDLRISYRTVEAHLHKIKQKLKCETKNELIDKIFSNELLRNYLLKTYW
jgi:DNA-binding CsgD family transcriptional regulator